jgi:hypothetical protein
MLRRIVPAALVVFATSCTIGDPTVDDGDDGPGGPDDIGVQPFAEDPANLNIGFNDGSADEFNYYDDFFQSGIHNGPRLCHTYVAWNIADQAPHNGTVTDPATRAYLDDWLAKAQGHCDEALISFKAPGHGNPPATSTYAAAFEKFAATSWATETGFTGSFAFTPWNEPNNAADAGTGLGVAIDARVAARYYLAAERSCRKHGCKVAAGDFASNGDMWDAFEWNCANDNVAPSELCKSRSSANSGTQAASYLDRYKNEIVNSASDFGLPGGFRPEYFAYHGWHDANRFLDAGDHCSTYATCALRRILRSLGGSWDGAQIWDTEDGAGQSESPDDHDQACTAAFMVRLQAITSRVRRLYVTRLHGGGGQLIRDGHVARPALGIFANRRTTYDGTCQ